MAWGRPFSKGVSGNPAGRPRSGDALAEYVRKLGGQDGKRYVDELHAIATSPAANDQLRLKALDVLLERGYGKPVQAVDLHTELSTSPSPEELAERLTSDELRQLESFILRAQAQPVHSGNGALSDATPSRTVSSVSVLERASHIVSMPEEARTEDTGEADPDLLQF